MTLHIENDTHWRTPDIRRLVRFCIAAAQSEPGRSRTVNVVYNTRRRKKKASKKSTAPAVTSVSTSEVEVNVRARSTVITIKLPKNGPKQLHPNAMVVIAAMAAAPTDGTLLAPTESFRLANGLAHALTKEPAALTREHGLRSKFRQNLWSIEQPEWCADGSKLLICKVKDPLKDGTYLDFVAKKEAQLRRAETTIEKELANIASAKRRLKNAEDKKKEIERSLRAARERRTGEV